jgi:hypothetical protein
MTKPYDWTTERIERDWIVGPLTELGERAQYAVRAFQAVDHHLGGDWLLAHRTASWGTGPTLAIVHLGQCLVAVEDLDGADVLVSKIRSGDLSALSELEAIWMFSEVPNVEIELAPDLRVGSSVKKPDFRIRRRGERWTFVEVTRPDMSDAAQAAQQLLQRLNDVMLVARAFSMEIFLRRNPDQSEEKSLLAESFALADSDTFGRVDIPGLAIITKEPFTGPVVTPLIHPEEDNSCPRFGVATGVLGGDGSQPQRLVCVRMPFTDDRADIFIKREAAQLSRDEQGLVMIDMSAAQIGVRGWVPLLRRRLQPNIHTRVGGLCLFTKGTELGHSSPQLLFEIATIANPHAPQPLPSWIWETLSARAIADNAKRAVPHAKAPT